MWLVVRYQYACSPEVVSMFDRCCQAVNHVVQLSAEVSNDRFYARFEGNFKRRAIDDIPMNAGEDNQFRKSKKSKSNTFVLPRKSAKEVMTGY